MVVAETERLLLRELTPADAPRLFAVYADPDVMRFMGPPPASVEAERDGIGRHAESHYRRLGYGLWAVVERATGTLVGRAGLLRFDPGADPPAEPEADKPRTDRPRVEISYLLARPFWGKGYATEAAGAVVRRAFDGLGIERLAAVINPANHASARVAGRLGFRRQGTIRYKQFGVVDLYERGPGAGTEPRMSTFTTSRDIPAPPDQVFAAIVDPRRLARWWGPAGFTNTFDVCAVGPGGRWSFTMHGPDGASYPNEAVFAAVEPPARVVVDHVSEPRFRLTITLAPSAAGGTTVSWAQAFESADLARRIEPIVVPANEQNLDRLTAEVLSELDGG